MASPVGSAIGAFGSSSIVPTWYDKGVAKNLKFLDGQFQGDNSSIMDAFNNFQNANANTVSKLNNASNQAYNDYNNLYGANVNYNPLDTYNSIRTGNLNALSNWASDLEGAGSKNDKLALAAMGMGGSPNSSYASILRADRVSKNIAPVLGNIMSSLGSDTATIGNQRSQNLSDLTGLINNRSNAPLIGYGMQLDPANALLALRNGQTGQLGNMAGVARENTAGFSLKPDTLGKLGNAMNGFNDALWQNVGNAMSVYSSLYGGGMGGGGGIKTGNPSGGGYAQTSGPVGGFNGGGSGGGMDSNTLLSLMKMFGANQGQSQTPQVQDPWANYGGTNGSMNYYDFAPSSYGNYA